MKKLFISSSQKNQMIDITTNIQHLIEDEKIKDGFVIVYIPHTTAGITINEGADPNVQKDIIEALQKIIPARSNYKHKEGNSDAHIKASLLGSSITILVSKDILVLGNWQKVFLYEGDGPRSRRIYVYTNKNK